MEIDKALDQISEIHGHLAKSDVFRGYRAAPVAFSGVLALLAAAFQTRVVGDESPEPFVLYWVAVALLASATAGGGILHSYALQEDPFARRKTRTVVGQLVPSMAAGVVVTVPMTMGGSVCIAFLPGIWAVLYSLGIFASRPYLPKMIGWIALFYLAAGAVLLVVAGRTTNLSPWGMGLTFGAGQVLAGIVLYWNLERKNVN